MTDQIRGTVIAVVAVLVLSPDILLLRLVDSDPWTIVFWRSSLMCAALIGYLLLSRRTPIVECYCTLGATGLVAGCCYAIVTILFVTAVHQTSAGHVAFLIATTPIFAALSGWVVLRETVPLRTWLAIVGALVCVGLILSENLAAGFGLGSALLGDLTAIGVALFLGTAFTLFRLNKQMDTIAAVSCGAFVAAMASASLAQPFSLSGDQFPLMALIGLFVAPVSFGLLTLAPRYIPSAEVGLLVLGESILAPIWVWFVISEAPTRTALIGGGMLLIVLAAHSVAAIRGGR